MVILFLIHFSRDILNLIGRTLPDKKIWVSDMLDQCSNYSRIYLKSPFEKGFLTHWDFQVEILDRLFSHNMQFDPTTSNLLISEPCFNLPNIQAAYDEIMFEEYNVKAYARLYGYSISLF